MSEQKFVFGIYPGGAAGSDDGIACGPPDDTVRINEALASLQGTAETFIVRVYERYSDADAPSRWPARSPEDFEQYVCSGRLLDLVVMFQSARGDVGSFLEFVRSMVRRHGPNLYSIQVTEEANFTDGPDAIDGFYPRVCEALTQGVIAAKDEAQRTGHSAVRVGFSTTPTIGTGFWSGIGALGGPHFVECLDYVALDFFPDVFRPLPEGAELRGAVVGILQAMRESWLPVAGIPASTPIHIGENGWPTGPQRSYERQSEVIETVVRTVYELRERFNIARYTLFDLRDTDSTKPEVEGDIFYHFGIMRDDYTPKPAFESYRRLIAELGRT